MEFFKRYFSGVDFDRGVQVSVKCPFHDDENPSATVNTEKSLFYCPVCGKGYNEVDFITHVNDIPKIEATRVLSKLGDSQTGNWGIIEKAELWSDASFIEELNKLGIENETIEKLDLGLVKGAHSERLLGIPIYYNGIIMDVRRYNVLKIPKIPKTMGSKDSENGYVFPYDFWKSDKRKTYIVEGEKDAILARQMGLNAITLTGGANALPNNMVLPSFKNKEVVICYDNDEAGRLGSQHLFKALYKVAKSVKYLDIGDIVNEHKEDFYDAVKKYGMDLMTFEMLEEHDFDKKLLKEDRHYITIKKALNTNQIRKKLSSVVSISAEYSDVYALPIVAEVEKVVESGKSSSIMLGDKRTWFFEKEKHVEQVLELVESNAKKNIINSKIKYYVGIPENEKGVSVKITQFEAVYKYRIIDSNSKFIDADTHDDTHNNTMLDLYSFQKLNVGTEYHIEYLLLPHPEKHQKLTAVAMKTEEMSNDKDFIIDLDKLKYLRGTGSVKERVKRLHLSAKHHIAKHLNYNMWLMEDLVFNSILNIKYGVETWGALDVFILGDTSTGKSESSKGLVDLYDFGHFLSLKTSTTIGLIGGSKKDGESMVNTIGAIPRQHKKLVVMEEFSGADSSFIKTMTDIRTTRRVHIVRVAGELEAPCNLRMITISNPTGDEHGLPKYVSTFPNGVMPLMELIGNPEDVSRYDGFLLVPQVTDRFNPFGKSLEGEKIPKELYEHKAKWVYTRGVENVQYAEGVQGYIWEKAEELNDKYECNFPLFGTKAPLKLARFSIALASLVLNVDDSFENIIVTKEIVDFIVDYFNDIYDNPIFKLKEYKDEYDSYSVCTSDDIADLEKMYHKNANFIEYLAMTSVTSMETLRANSGIDGKDFNALYSKFAQRKFIKSLGRQIVPTTKFRKANKLIDKTFTTAAGKMSSGNTFKL